MEIMNCPFCGSRPRLLANDDRAYITCDKCKVKGKTIHARLQWKPWGADGSRKKYRDYWHYHITQAKNHAEDIAKEAERIKEEAITLWNQRV